MASEDIIVMTASAEGHESISSDDEKARQISFLTAELEKLEKESRLARQEFQDEKSLWIQQLSRFEEMVRRAVQSSSSVTEKTDIPLVDVSEDDTMGISQRDTSISCVSLGGNSQERIATETRASCFTSSCRRRHW